MNPIQVRCPRCGAKPGKTCNNAYYFHLGSPHLARARLAKAGIKCPTCHAAPPEPCVMEDGRTREEVHAARKQS